MATHPVQDLLEKVKAALEADSVTGEVLNVVILVDEDLLPSSQEFPIIGLTDEGSGIEYGAGDSRDEVMEIGVTVFQEMALPEVEAPGLMGYPVENATIEEKGALELLADIRAVLDGQALTGYRQGQVTGSTAAELMPVDAVVDEATGEIEAVRCWVVRKKETYRYTKYE